MRKSAWLISMVIASMICWGCGSDSASDNASTTIASQSATTTEQTTTTETTASPTTTTEAVPPVVSATPDGQAVPTPVLNTAQLIYRAAQAEDLPALGALAAAPDFTYVFGDPPGDPVAYWSGNPQATTGEMVRVLEQSVATDGSTWWWPAEWLTDETYFGYRIGIDNAGSRYTGEHRFQATLNANSQMLFGDRLTLRGMVSDHSMWLGSVDYEAPIGGSGLRGQIGYGDNYYQLGGQFAALDATGFAKVTTARLSYPILRSQASNVTVSGAYQNKRLEDRYGATGTVNEKSSNSWPVAVQFDHRDRFGGGGITYGMATWTSGNLNLNGAFATTDAATAQTAGHFNKYNLDIARIQKLPGDFALYGRYSAQWTSQNLDSSERFGLGGIYGVRAYPLGEGMGDRGWLGQLELRYLAGPYTPFVFYDAGRSDTNARPWDTASSTSRSIAGGGAGVRVDYKQWSIDSTLAWRTRGGPASADTSDRSPRLWFMATYSF